MTMPTSGRGSDRVARERATGPTTAAAQHQSADDSRTSSAHQSVRSRYVTAARAQRLASRLSDRERAVLASLRRLRVATSAQLERLHFAEVTPRQARMVLASLVEQGLIARLPRRVGGVRAGSAGYVYVLDVAGQRLSPLSGRRVQRPWPVGTPFLAHSLAVSELYVRLMEAERQGRAELRLGEYRTEPACWRRFAAPGAGRLTLKPDAEVTLRLGRFEDRWFIEVDRATESRSTLDRKLGCYVRYWQSGQEQARLGIFPKVLWIVPDSARVDVLVDACGRLPVAAWPLFAVITEAGAVERLLAGADT
jgi:hypothetical protein